MGRVLKCHVLIDLKMEKFTPGDALVKYATAGLPHNVFVSKYMTNLPSEEELEKIIVEEQKKLN